MVELVWDGKYDADGKKSRPVRVALPFQDVETVNESAQVRTRMLDLWGRGQPGEWRNRLIWGDKKYVLPSLLPEFAGKVNLIYIDPPFATGADFSFTAQIPDDPTTEGDQSASFVKQPSMIEQKAYRDTWGRGLDGYLQWFYETVVLLHELLAEDGSLFVHLDDNVGHYAKVILDECFGSSCYQNEVIWQRTDPHNDARNRFGNIHDTIFWYGKSRRPRYYPEEVRTPLSPAAEAEYSLLELPDGRVVPYKGNETKVGRRFKLENATWKGNNPEKKFTWRGATPPRNREWMYTYEEMEAALARGELYLRDPNRGTLRCRKSYLDENKGIVLQDIWTDAGRVKGGSRYATEKPEPLLERIIKAASKEGDLVLDCFVGSGTTAAVAEKLNRRWIVADLSRFAIHTTRKRLLSIPEVRPFVVQNLGKYERQAWQGAEFGGDGSRAAEAQARYRRFILDLYHAEPLEGYIWLHGVRAGRFVHVGSVDAPVLADDLKAIAREVWQAAGKGTGATTNGVDVLGWDFAFELNELGKQMAQEAHIDLAFKRIPRDVMDRRAVEQGDITFFELAALDVAVKAEPGRRVCVELRDFVVPPDDVPQEVREAITHWSQFIDYWAVDWDYREDTFHNQWQSYRTKKDPTLALSTSHVYEAPGTYTVVVKVIDILGNDTTRSMTVEVR